VSLARTTLHKAVRGRDDRLIVVAGPAAIHDPEATMEYARKLQVLAKKFSDTLIVVMRVFSGRQHESSRSWAGQMHDPDINGSYQINKGFRQARQLLLDINRLGLPAACQYTDTITPQFIADLVSWAMVEGRTTSSAAHRELASGLSTPVGFQNSPSGDAQAAVDAVRDSAGPHAFLSVSKQGVAGIVETTGNHDCHVVLHGGKSGPNHSGPAVSGVCASLEALGLPARVMVDCGSFNAGGNPAAVAQEVASQVAAGSSQILGVTLPSFLLAGRQELVPGKPLIHGMSVTETCMDWSATAEALAQLAGAVEKRRSAGSNKRARAS